MTSDPVAAFIEAAVWQGTLERANAMLAERPEIAGSGIHAAAVLGDDAGVRRFLALDPGSATATTPPYGGTALVYLCLSKYLRLDPARSDGFLRAAPALRGGGADPNDAETPYHTPETYDNAALRVLVESGRMTADSLAMMLLRKAVGRNR